MEGGKRAVYVRSRGTRRRGSGRKRETIVDEFGGGPACEMRIARLGWLHGRPSWVQTGWEKLVGPSLRLSLSLSLSLLLLLLLLLLCSSSLLSSSASSSHSLARRPSHFYFVCATLRCTALSPSFSLSLSFSFLRRAKMVHGRSRAPISPRILRGGSTSTPFFILRPLLLVLPLYSPRFFAPAVSQSRRGFSSRYSFLYARDCIVHLFNAR